MFTEALFTIAKRLKQLMSVHKRMNEQKWFTYNHVLFSLRKEVLTWATTWRSLENITPREISPSQKGKYCMIPFL